MDEIRDFSDFDCGTLAITLHLHFHLHASVIRDP